jgi:hypothetical protein
MLQATVFSHSVYYYGVTFYMDPLAMLKPTWCVVFVQMCMSYANQAVSQEFIGTSVTLYVIENDAAEHL